MIVIVRDTPPAIEKITSKLSFIERSEIIVQDEIINIVSVGSIVIRLKCKPSSIVSRAPRRSPITIHDVAAKSNNIEPFSDLQVGEIKIATTPKKKTKNPYLIAQSYTILREHRSRFTSNTILCGMPNRPIETIMSISALIVANCPCAAAPCVFIIQIDKTSIDKGPSP